MKCYAIYPGTLVCLPNEVSICLKCPLKRFKEIVTFCQRSLQQFILLHKTLNHLTIGALHISPSFFIYLP